ncbi:MAG: Peptide deformylase [Labilithrix sp.]|jgi:peptide deformylase|nr:Peptide deformylase [Labilithrix sp.]
MPKHLHAHPIDAHRPDTSTAPNGTISGTYRRVVVRRVLTRPNALLARRSRDIDPRAPGVVALAEELVTTMRASPGCVGLAAPQIGELVRMFCVDVTGHRKTKSCAGLVILVNPRVVERTEDVVMREGCLSVPDFTGDVARAATVVVEGFEPGSSTLVRIAANAMEARCLLHEIDHLDGILFTDRVVDPEKSLFARKVFG